MFNEEKKAGLWLDHKKAHLVGMNDGKVFLNETINSPYDPRVRFKGEKSNVTQFRAGEMAVSNNEDRKYNRIQQEFEAFYHVLRNRLQDFDAIVLFGQALPKNNCKIISPMTNHSVIRTLK